MEQTGPKQQRVFGEAIQAVMAKRGCELTLHESQQLARGLLDLIAIGAFVPVNPQGVTLSSLRPDSHEAEIAE